VKQTVFGHNTNIRSGAHTFHVQTEDRGESHALIDTTVYFRGRVLHRRTNNYLDLLPLNEDSQQALKMRVDQQHRQVLEEIRNGALPLAVPPGTEPMRGTQMGHSPAVPAKGEQSPARETKTEKKSLELLNARNWLTGKQAKLQVAVQGQNGSPVVDAKVSAEIEGGTGNALYRGVTGDTGRATISFEMPKLTGAEVALVIRLEGSNECAPVRYTLRAKPRVPAV